MTPSWVARAGTPKVAYQPGGRPTTPPARSSSRSHTSAAACSSYPSRSRDTDGSASPSRNSSRPVFAGWSKTPTLRTVPASAVLAVRTAAGLARAVPVLLELLEVLAVALPVRARVLPVPAALVLVLDVLLVLGVLVVPHVRLGRDALLLLLVPAPGLGRRVAALLRPALVETAVGMSLLVEMHAVSLTRLVDAVANRLGRKHPRHGCAGESQAGQHRHDQKTSFQLQRRTPRR